MSTKRRKISHELGSLKSISGDAPKPKSKTDLTPKTKAASPPPSSDAESTTLDNASKQGNGDAAPKTFADLVWTAKYCCWNVVR